jgi:predicted dehydrogenase
MKNIKIGVIGCGLMGGIHAECFAREKNCEVVGYTNPTRSKAEALAQKLGGVVYDSVADLLEYSGCDAVVVASPQQAHSEQIIAAAKAGKHIFAEKPLALTVEEFDAIEKAVEKSGVAFMVAHQMRFHPVVEWVRKNQKRLGKIYHLDLEWALLIKGHQGRCFEDYRSGGFFMELGCHATDLSRHLMGEVRDVTARTLRLDPKRVTEDCTHCLLQFESNVIGSILVSANHRGKRQGLLSGRVLGAKGRIEFSIYPYERAFNEAQIVFDGGQSTFVPDVKIEKMPKEFAPSLSNSYKGFFDIYQQEAAAFLRALRSGSTPPITLRDGRAAIEIILAAYDSQSQATQKPNFTTRRKNFRSDASSHPALQ